jgi:aspartate racemase
MAQDAHRPVIGVLGGMGPAATADFYARLVAATPAARDQDHPRVLIDGDPTVPCRNAALAGRGPSPGPVLAAMAQGLERSGADVLVMPCNAAHVWAAQIRAATSLPFIHMIEVTVGAALRLKPGLRIAGVLAASACLDGRLYHDAFAHHGVELRTPEGAARERFMTLIGRIKRGDAGPEVQQGMAELARDLVEAGAELVVAGCTEVPLVLSAPALAVPLVNSTDVLVARTLEFRPG